MVLERGSITLNILSLEVVARRVPSKFQVKEVTKPSWAGRVDASAAPCSTSQILTSLSTAVVSSRFWASGCQLMF